MNSAEKSDSAIRGHRLFLLGFFFLFFSFVFVADQFEDGYFGIVANAVAGMDDAGVAAGAIGEFWGDLAEEFGGHSGSHQVRGRLAAGLQRVALA